MSVRWVARLSCGHDEGGISAAKWVPEAGSRMLCQHAEHGLSEVTVVEVVDDRPQRGPDGKR